MSATTPPSALTREDFLARCATAYDAGLIRPGTTRLLERWVDMVLRYEAGLDPVHPQADHQMRYFTDHLETEGRRTEGFSSQHTLASDRDGYALIQLAAILGHPCQICATNLQAWWTRTAFCPHDKPEPRPAGEPEF